MLKTVLKFYIFVFFSIMLLCGCSSEPHRINIGTAENAYDDAYNEGYRKGYEDGIDHIIDVLRENAYDGDVYMDVEDIKDAIHLYFDDVDYIDADEVKDAILHHPDFDHYSLKDLLDKLLG